MKEEPIKLLALITSNYRLYYQCKILSRKGYSGQQIAKQLMCTHTELNWF